MRLLVGSHVQRPMYEPEAQGPVFAWLTVVAVCSQVRWQARAILNKGGRLEKVSGRFRGGGVDIWCASVGML